MRRFGGPPSRQAGGIEFVAVPLVLGVSEVFDSFEAVMRLAQMTGMAEEFGEYAAARKATLFYNVGALQGSAGETGAQTDGSVLGRCARRTERRGNGRRSEERRVSQLQLAHVMGQGAVDRRRGERRTGERRTGERRRSKES